MNNLTKVDELMTIEMARTQFLNELQRQEKSLGTIKEYQKDLKMFLTYLTQQRQRPIEQVLEGDLVAYLDYLIKERHYLPSSRNRQMNTLRSFFKYCKRVGILKENPAEYLELIEVVKTECISLVSEEVDELVKAVDHPLIKLVILTLFFTGARINECLSLEVRDIDFDQKTLFIRNGKGNKFRLMPLHRDLEKLLKKYIEGWRVSSDSNKLFLTERSGGLSAVYVNRVLKETVEKLKWDKKVTCHVFRHSFASILVNNSANILAVQQLLGHVSLNTTSGYLHIQQQTVEETIQKLAL